MKNIEARLVGCLVHVQPGGHVWTLWTTLTPSLKLFSKKVMNHQKESTNNIGANVYGKR